MGELRPLQITPRVNAVQCFVWLHTQHVSAQWQVAVGPRLGACAMNGIPATHTYRMDKLKDVWWRIATCVALLPLQSRDASWHTFARSSWRQDDEKRYVTSLTTDLVTSRNWSQSGGRGPFEVDHRSGQHYRHITANVLIYLAQIKLRIHRRRVTCYTTVRTDVNCWLSGRHLKPRMVLPIRSFCPKHWKFQFSSG